MKKLMSFKSSRRQCGITLVELLIALALSLAVLVGLSSVYVAVKQSFRFQENTGRLQEDATFALDTMSRELRMAGFAGCAGINRVTVGATTTDYPDSVLSSGSPNTISGPNPLAQVETSNAAVTAQPFTPVNFIRGFDNVPSAMFASGSVPSSSGTDSLFFAGGSNTSVGLSAAMATASAPMAVASDPYNWRTPSGESHYMVVSDCISSSLFEGTVNSGGTSIAHDGGGNSTATFDTANFPTGYLFGTDAIVMLAQWNFFYVATRPGASTPSLYRVTFNGKTRSAAEEIVSNVESMQLHYGENTAMDSLGFPTLVAENWRTTAATVTDWSRVVAVRVGLMMVSAEDNTSPDVVLTTPTLLGQAYTLPTGASTNRLRKEFSTTVVLRNRVAAR